MSASTAGYANIGFSFNIPPGEVPARMDDGGWASANELVAASTFTPRDAPVRNVFAVLGGTAWAMPWGIQIGTEFKTRPRMAQLQARPARSRGMVWKYSPEAKVLFHHLVRTFPELVTAIQSGWLVETKDANPLTNANQFVYGLTEGRANEIANWLLDVNGNPRESLPDEVIISCISSYSIVGGPMPTKPCGFAPVDDVDDVWTRTEDHRFAGLEPMLPFLHNLLDEHGESERLSKSETAASGGWAPGPRQRKSSIGASSGLSRLEQSTSATHLRDRTDTRGESPPSRNSSTSTHSRELSLSTEMPRRASFERTTATASMLAAALSSSTAPTISRELWNALYDEYLYNNEAGARDAIANAAINASATGSSAALVPVLRQMHDHARTLSPVAAVASHSRKASSSPAARGISPSSNSSAVSTVSTVGADGLSAIVRPFTRNAVTPELESQVATVLKAVASSPECVTTGCTKTFLGIGFREVLKCARRSTLHAVIIATDIERNTTEDLGRRIDILTTECRNLGIPYAFVGTRQVLATVLGKSGSISCVGFIRVTELLPELDALVAAILRAHAEYGAPRSLSPKA